MAAAGGGGRPCLARLISGQDDQRLFQTGASGTDHHGSRHYQSMYIPLRIEVAVLLVGVMVN